MLGHPFEIHGVTCFPAFALHRLGCNTDMGGRRDVDAAFGVGPSIDAEFEAGEGQMLVLEGEQRLR
jgi:hypothetical protein